MPKKQDDSEAAGESDTEENAQIGQIPECCQFISKAQALNLLVESLAAHLPEENEEIPREDLEEIAKGIWDLAGADFDYEAAEQAEEFIELLSNTLDLEESMAILVFHRLLSKCETCFPPHLQDQAPEGQVVYLDVPEDFPYPCTLSAESVCIDDIDLTEQDLELCKLLHAREEDLALELPPELDPEVDHSIGILFLQCFEAWMNRRQVKEEVSLLRDCALDYFEQVQLFLWSGGVSLKESAPDFLMSFFTADLSTREGVGPNAFSFYLNAVFLFYQYLMDIDFLEYCTDYFDLIDVLQDTHSAIQSEFLENIKDQLN